MIRSIEYARVIEYMKDIHLPPENDTTIPIGKVISLKVIDNGMWLSSGNGSSPLIANRQTPQTWESFALVDMSLTYGPYAVAFLAKANNKYVCADDAGDAPLIANRAIPGLWETFFWIVNSDQTVSFQAGANGFRVCLDGGNDQLFAERLIPGVPAKFAIQIW
jgi:hypothetical protein